MAGNTDSSVPIVPLAQPIPPSSVPPDAASGPSATKQTQEAGMGTGVAPVTPTPQMTDERPQGVGPDLSNAPDTLTQTAPSAFQAGNATSIGKKKFPFFRCCCSIIILLVLAVLGLGAYAYLTDTDIPIISDITDRIKEKFRSKESEAALMQQRLASTAAGLLVPLVQNDKGFITSVIGGSIEESYVENLVQDYQAVDSLRFDLSLVSTTSVGSQSTDTNLSITGAFDTKNQDAEKFEAQFSYDTISSGVPITANGELKTVGTNSYLKIDTLPAISSEVDSIVDKYKGKWIDISQDEASSTGSLFNLGAVNLSNSDLKKLTDFVTDQSIVKNIQKLPDESIEGNTSQCMSFSWNQSELLDVIRRYDEIYGHTYNEEDVLNSLTGIETTSMEVCIGKKDERLYRLRLKVDGDNSENAAILDLNLKLWDYGTVMDITAPEESTNFEDILEELSNGNAIPDFSQPVQ